MPSFDAYKIMAKDRGSLAFETYVVQSKPIEGKDFTVHLQAHLAYIKSQEEAGNLMIAGPLSDIIGQDMSGIGLQVWRAASWEDAKALADADPMHIEGVKTYEMRRWLINEGNLQVSIGLSTGGIGL